jgi:hypothetical protein
MLFQMWTENDSFLLSPWTSKETYLADIMMMLRRSSGALTECPFTFEILSPMLTFPKKGLSDATMTMLRPYSSDSIGLTEIPR